MIQKTYPTICRECGQHYDKADHTLDLNIGDLVMHESHTRPTSFEDMKKCMITITDISYKEEGLYFGSYHEPVWGNLITNCRVDTRNNPYVKLTPNGELPLEDQQTILP